MWSLLAGGTNAALGRGDEMPDGEHIRVMVVEDGPVFQELLILTLSLEPYFELAYIADSGEEALEEFAKVSPDLVLMDFRLPGIDGLETAKRMKAQRPAVKVAIVTAYAEEVLNRAAKDAGVLDVIPKASFSLERVRQLLGLPSPEPHIQG